MLVNETAIDISLSDAEDAEVIVKLIKILPRDYRLILYGQTMAILTTGGLEINQPTS